MSITELRQTAQACFQAAVHAADPYQGVVKALSASRDGVQVEGGTQSYRRVHVLSFGKAALRMAQAACDVIEPALRASTPIVVTNEENYQAFCIDKTNKAFLQSICVYQGGHPLPTEQGQQGAHALLERAQGARDDELVLVLISGGGSALAPMPPTGITLADKIKTTELLLHSGASIQQMNVVRKHLSLLKGGRLAQAAHPAKVHALILSDVIGDDLATIASGPTVVDTSTYADALRVIEHFDIASKVPESVWRYMQEGTAGKHAESLKAGDAAASSSAVLVGSNRFSVEAALREANKQGFAAQIWRFDACGEARVLAQEFAQMVAKQPQKKAYIFGGETTVHVVGTGGVDAIRNWLLLLHWARKNTRCKESGCFSQGALTGEMGPRMLPADASTAPAINAGYKARIRKRCWRIMIATLC